MRKRLLSLLLTVAMVLSLLAFPASAETTSGTCGENVNWTLENGVLTISGTGEMSTGYSSTPWDSQRATITSVVIENGVTSIDSYAFYGCPRLTSVAIPSSVTSIGWAAFSGCSKLTGITIPDSVTSIDSSAFCGCSSLSTISIPNGVTSIGSCAFEGCKSLTSIEIPDGVTSIGFFTFYNCTSLASITIANSVTSIGSSAFSGCTSLTSISIPDNVTKIESGTFSGCTSLASISIPDSVTWIEKQAFYGCTGLTAIDVDPNNTYYCSVDGVLFSKDMTELILYPAGKTDQSYSIPDGVTSISDYAFYDCKSLTSIAIPDSVTSIAEHTFWNCGINEINASEDITGGRISYWHGSAQYGETSTFKIYAWSDYWLVGYPTVTTVNGDPVEVTKVDDETYTFIKPSAAVTISASFIKTFTDAEDSSEYYYAPVYWAVGNKITTGATETSFEPMAKCTRAQVVTFLWRAAGCPEPTTTVSPFTDVQNSSEYYYKAVLWAVEKGITTGATETTFEPESTCTRAQIVTFLWRYENYPEPTATVSPFVDVQDSSAYYYKAVLWAVEKGITLGTDTTHFSPEETCIRAQVVTFLYRDMA